VYSLVTTCIPVSLPGGSQTLHNMNDPGLDKSATQAAEDVEANNTQYAQDKEQAEAEEQEFLKPG
jgi:hypothetical protein